MIAGLPLSFAEPMLLLGFDVLGLEGQIGPPVLAAEISGGRFCEQLIAVGLQRVGIDWADDSDLGGPGAPAAGFSDG